MDTPQQATLNDDEMHLNMVKRDSKERDVLAGQIWEVSNVLRDNIGLVALVDIMPRLVPEDDTIDDKIANVARVSYGEGTRTITDNSNLVRYLYRHWHTGPFEFVQLDFMIVTPIFVRAQLMRHRTGSYNEESARYSIVRDEQYIPPRDRLKTQSVTNKQGSSSNLVSDAGAEKYYHMLKLGQRQHEEYEVLIKEHDLARELARLGLTQNTYTRYRFTMNLHNILHLLRLRMDHHAQEETRYYANAIYKIVALLLPVTIRAFEDYSLQSINLSRMEIDAIQQKSVSLNEDLPKRERDEYSEKLKKLGLSFNSQ